MNRTVWGLIQEYRKEWGILLFTLSLHEIVKLAINMYAPIHPIAGHGLFIVLVLFLWAASDHVDVNTEADFWR